MIQKTFGKIDGLRIGIVGDLKYGRTVHSLVYALAYYNVEIVFISPSALRLPANTLKKIRSSVNAYEDELLHPWLDKVDLLYVTRIQKERFSDPLDYEKVKNSYRITPEMLEGKSVKIMHPLPKVNEISPEVDKMSNAIYFDQVECGIYVREAVLSLLKS
jgi:aspartate carbamoyltransferase catalytic subunit